MILNEQPNQLFVSDKQYENIQNMLLSVINMITKSDATEDRYEIGVDFTNFHNVNMHNISWALQELGYEDGEIRTNGWDMDFWQNFVQPPKGFPPVQCSGNGADRVVIVRGNDEDTNTYKPLEKNRKYAERIKQGDALLHYYFEQIRKENNRTGMIHDNDCEKYYDKYE